MNLILYTLKMVAYTMVNPIYIIALFVLGINFYIKNRKISTIQRMTIGEFINSPIELTLSQIAIGIIAGAIMSIIMSMLGLMFDENSGIEIIFLASIIFMFTKRKFIGFTYLGAILVILSILSKVISSLVTVTPFFNINTVELITLIGVISIVQGILIVFDGSRGAIPIFSNRDNKIVGGFIYNRYWIIPIAILIIVSTNISDAESIAIQTPSFWPLINRAQILPVLASLAISALPMYGSLGYRDLTFTKDKIKKPIISGSLNLIYGILAILIGKVAEFGLLFEVIAIVILLLTYRLLIKIMNRMESSGKYIYVTDEEGISILEVIKDSSAYKSGVRRGDKIIEVNREVVKSEKEILNIVKSNASEIELKIKSLNGKIKDAKFKLTNKRLGFLLVPSKVDEGKVVKLNDNGMREERLK